MFRFRVLITLINKRPQFSLCTMYITSELATSERKYRATTLATIIHPTLVLPVGYFRICDQMLCIINLVIKRGGANFRRVYQETWSTGHRSSLPNRRTANPGHSIHSSKVPSYLITVLAIFRRLCRETGSTSHRSSRPNRRAANTVHSVIPGARWHYCGEWVPTLPFFLSITVKHAVDFNCTSFYLNLIDKYYLSCLNCTSSTYLKLIGFLNGRSQPSKLHT